MVGADLAADRDAVTIGKPDVEDGDVGSRRGDPGERALGGVGFADDLDVVLGVEQLPDPTTDDLVVVEQEHADHRVVHEPGAYLGVANRLRR